MFLGLSALMLSLRGLVRAVSRCSYGPACLAIAPLAAVAPSHRYDICACVVRVLYRRVAGNRAIKNAPER